MKQSISILSAVLLLLCAMAIPLAGASANTTPTTTTMLTTTTSTRVGVSETTTRPLTTTTTWYDCISTTTTWPPTTTSTTLNLTGPDGTAPEYGDPTRTTGTTAAPSGELDLLTTAYIGTSDSVSVLAGPYQDYGFCADCYSLDGGTITIAPRNGYDVPLSYYRYLHLTVNTTMPFSLTLTDNNYEVEAASAMWFAAAMNSADATIAKGPYVAVIDLHAAYKAALGYVPTTVTLPKFDMALSGAGSVSVGHLVLSPDAVCVEQPPAIQTTTFPKFPWDDETTGTTDTTTMSTAGDTTLPPTSTRPTTNPTVGDVFVMGDMDADYFVTTTDARMLLQYTIGAIELDDRALMLADVNYDGAINTADARETLKLTL